MARSGAQVFIPIVLSPSISRNVSHDGWLLGSAFACISLRVAAFAFQAVPDTRYAAFSRGAGGVILIGFGIWMLTL
jgi:hypothetical protein